MRDALFPAPSPVIDQRSCFVLMPFRSPFNEIFSDHLLPTLNRLRVRARRADEIFSTQSVVLDIWTGITSAAFLLAELTGRNPNVLYELGLAHALQKPVVLLGQSTKDLPFDIRGLRTIIYEFTPRGCQKLENHLASTVRELLLDLNLLTVGVAGSNRQPENPYRGLALEIGVALLRAGYSVVSGGGKGLAFEVVNGMADALSSRPLEAYPGTIETFKPIGYVDFPAPPIGQVFYEGRTWSECRQRWVKEADILLVCGGGQGTTFEIECALDQQIPILTLRGTGGAADELASSVAGGRLPVGSCVSLLDCPGSESLRDGPTARVFAEAVVDRLRMLSLGKQQLSDQLQHGKEDGDLTRR